MPELELSSMDDSWRSEVSSCGEEPMQECKDSEETLQSVDNSVNKYDSLNYWKTPIEDVHIDINSL